MDTNDALFIRMKDAIENYFSDRSVSPETTRARLEEVVGDLDMKIDALSGDIARREAVFLDEYEEDDDWLLADPEEDDYETDDLLEGDD